MNDSLKELGEMVGAHTKQAPHDEGVLEAVRERLQTTALRRSGIPPRRMFQAALVLSAICALLMIYGLKIRRSEPLSVFLEAQSHVPVGNWIKAQDETKRLRFSDGTSVSLLPATDILVKEVTPDGATVLLGRGRTLAQVEQEEGAKWKFLAGPFAIRVTGTEFDLAWDPGKGVLELALHHGSVVLSGPTLPEGRIVRKGEFVRVELSDAQTKPVSKTLKAVVPAPVSEPSEPQKNVAEWSEQDWRKLLFSGERQQALQAVMRAGTSRVLANASADELGQISQIARLGGQASLARDALLMLRERFGQTGQTAYLLGKVHADQLGEVQKAIQWFEIYLTESPTGTLREQAMGRLVHLQAGRPAGRRAAQRYLDDYPDGSFAPFARSL